MESSIGTDREKELEKALEHEVWKNHRLITALKVLVKSKPFGWNPMCSCEHCKAHKELFKIVATAQMEG